VSRRIGKRVFVFPKGGRATALIFTQKSFQKIATGGMALLVNFGPEC
jgi:hypothetical protein